VCQKRVRDVDELKEHLVEVAYARSLTIPQPDAVSNHRRRVRASDTYAQLGLGRACYRWPEIGRYEFWCILAGADIRRWHVHDEPARCTAGSALVTMATSAAGTPLY